MLTRFGIAIGGVWALLWVLAGIIAPFFPDFGPQITDWQWFLMCVTIGIVGLFICFGISRLLQWVFSGR